MKKAILVASASEDFQVLIKAIFSETHTVYCASGIDEAFNVLDSYAVHIIISSAKARDWIRSFIAQLRSMDRRMREIPYIVLTNDINTDLISTAHNYNVEVIKLPFEPISFTKRVEETLIRNAQNYEKPDPLTGLHKKQFAEEQIIELLAKGRKGALLLISIDRYKFASSGVSGTILISCRDVLKSVVTKNTVLAVSNTNSFILFVPELKEKIEIENYGNEIIKKFNEKLGNSIYVSIGLAVTGRHGIDYPDLFQQCDLGLHTARTMGKNTACFYSW